MIEGLSSYEAANYLALKLLRAEREIARLQGVIKKLERKDTPCWNGKKGEEIMRDLIRRNTG